MAGKNLWGVWGGAVLIGLGVIIMLGQFLEISIWGFLWPFFIIGPGVMFFIGMIAGGRSTGALAIPGSIITTVGLILFFQNLFNIWATWAYAWALIIAGVGVGLLIFARWSEVPDLHQVGRIVTLVGLGLFFVFGVFFELGAALLNLRSPGGLLWPVLLILAGIYLLVARPLLARSAGPVQRSEIAFSSGAAVPPAGAAYAPNAEGGPEPVIHPLGDAAAASPAVSGVRRLHLRAIGDLTLVQGEREGLEIEVNQAVRERLRVETRGDTLDIRLDNQWWNWIDPRYWSIGPIRYTLYLRELDALIASGLGNISAADLNAGSLEIQLNGSGNIVIRRLSAENLVVQQSGLGNIEIHGGRVSAQVVTLSGAGNYSARSLESRTARVSINGLGNATLAVSDDLDAALSGAGNVEYAGNPRVNQRVSGLGNIRRLS